MEEVGTCILVDIVEEGLVDFLRIDLWTVADTFLFG